MSKKHHSYFWPSYSDLMTSLFFVMLVLFMITVGALVRNAQASRKQLQAIREIEDAVRELPDSLFVYSEQHKKHILRINVEFETRRSGINNIVDRTILNDLITAGKEIEKIVTKFLDREDIDVQYLVIIEGQASRSPYNWNECENNNVLSYQRALTLKNFWEQNGIDLGSLPNCELIIAGSGVGGVPREPPDTELCTANQRFLIHVIPKPGIIQYN